jgi:phage baseplate assembly protein W
MPHIDSPTGRGLAFPFAVEGGQVRASAGDEAVRGRIVQVLFTAPGERLDMPNFGCGLFDLLFEHDDDLLTAATGFAVREALIRWLGDEIVVEGVDVVRDGPTVTVELAYTRRVDLVREGLRLRFEEGSAWTSS